MPFVLALVSAGLYGAADFLGGLAARRASVTAVVTVAQGTGFIILLLAVPFLPAATVTAADVGWGAGAGLAGGAGVALLYRALAVGTMAVVAPVTAVCAVLIPVVAELLAGQRLGGRTMAGIVIALVAIVLVGQQSTEGSGDAEGHVTAEARTTSPRAGLGLALLSGVAIGFFYLCLARTGPDAQMWPLLAARGASTLVFAAGAIAAGVSLRLPALVLQQATSGGVLDVTANALYLVATRGGALSIVVTLVSLYPASTVLLARLVLAERVSRVQAVGIVCALAAVVLIVSGG